MIEISKLQVGDKVHYRPDHYEVEESLNGVVKEIRDDVDGAVWVVFSCACNWDNYAAYTGERTDLCDLHSGWVKHAGGVYQR